MILLPVNRLALYGFPVRHLGIAHLGLHLEVIDDPGHENVQVQLPHARDDQLSGVLVIPDREGWILLLQLVQRRFQLGPLREGLGFDSH